MARKIELENLKLRKTTMDLLRKRKEETGVPMSVFVERTLLKELNEKKKKK